MKLEKASKLILLKLSGEAMRGEASFGHEATAMKFITAEILSAVKSNVKICIVVGGGNLFRGRQIGETDVIQRSTMDYMGMLATAINALALQDFLQSAGIKTRIFSSINISSICMLYSRDEALSALIDNQVIIFACGTGNPFVSTDTLAAIRAAELQCALILKGTQVDGVYNADPKKKKLAKKYDKISYDEVISGNLGIVDMSAILIAKEHKIPIAVFNMHKHGLIAKLVCGKAVYADGFSLIS